ncbi:MAG TPA: zinc dependent phospholipase C family protein, partial [Chitinophaga sp.]
MLTRTHIRIFVFLAFILISEDVHGWGFFAHQRINRLAVFCLPPEMMQLYKPHLEYITVHATDPDKRRYVVAAEGARHYIDIDIFDTPPYSNIPHSWQEALDKYGADSLNRNGILPWHLEKMLAILTRAFRDKDQQRILQVSAELGHYVADAHVPLHVSSNHNGQLTGQHGIHGFWESRIPELLADRECDYWA